MRRLVIPILLISTAAVAQPGNLITGRWRIHARIEGNDIASECTFLQSGNTVRGTCSSEEGTTDIKGTAKGDVVLISYYSDYNGTESTISYTGSVAAQTFSGQIAVDPDGATGKFTGTRVR
jgi:hypothetical protein